MQLRFLVKLWLPTNRLKLDKTPPKQKEPNSDLLVRPLNNQVRPKHLLSYMLMFHGG